MKVLRPTKTIPRVASRLGQGDKYNELAAKVNAIATAMRRRGFLVTARGLTLYIWEE